MRNFALVEHSLCSSRIFGLFVVSAKLSLQLAITKCCSNLRARNKHGERKTEGSSSQEHLSLTGRIMRSNILPARKRHIVARPFPRIDLSSPFQKANLTLEGEQSRKQTSEIRHSRNFSQSAFRINVRCSVTELSNGCLSLSERTN